MISVPIAVYNPSFRWQLNLFWFNHKIVYGSDAYRKAKAVVIKRNRINELLAKSFDWNIDIPYKFCDSFFDYAIGLEENGHLLPINIQIGLLQILSTFEDDEEVLELIDCDMFHMKHHPEWFLKDDEMFVSDVYENWHLKSLRDNHHVIEKYIGANAMYYNGGFVPLIAKVKTFKKIILDWIWIHKDIVKRYVSSQNIKWWAGMYALQAACEINKVKMIARDYCYVPNINKLSEEQYIAHYSVDKKFNKKLFPNIDLSLFEDNVYYSRIKKWYYNTIQNDSFKDIPVDKVSPTDLESLFETYLNRKPNDHDIKYHKDKSYAVLEYELQNCAERRGLLVDSKKILNDDNSGIFLSEERVKIAVGSNKFFCEKTLPICLPSLIDSGIKRSNIIVFIAGYSKRNSYFRDGIEFIELDHNSFENSAFVDIVENDLKSDYWFFIHDTCKVGPKFKNLMLNVPPNAEKVALRKWPSMSIGLYSDRYIKKYKNKLMKIKNKNYDENILMKEKLWGIPNEDYILWLEEPENTFIYKNYGMQVIDNENWFGQKTKRITEYHKNLDLYKNKSHWQTYHGRNLSL